MMKAHVFEPIIDILIESSSRNSLLNSAVLEFLQYLVKVLLFSCVTDVAGREEGNYHSHRRDVWRTI
jgi:hypothetical protein